MLGIPPYFVVQVGFAPLPARFVQALREIEVETSVGRASIFRLHFDLSRDSLGDFDVLAIDLFRPLMPVRISVSGGLGVPQALINGFVKDAQLGVRNEPGASTLEVVGMDALGTTMAHIQQPLIQTIVDTLLGDGECPSTGHTAALTNRAIDMILGRTDSQGIITHDA